MPFDKTLYYRVSGCCLPGTRESYGILPGYYGEITIDPASGAILRVQVQTLLDGFVPTNRSDVIVEYGPVVMGDKTYMVPLHSIAVHRGRTMLAQKQEDWNTSFETWGPFHTQISEFTFDHYHLFQGEMRILPGFAPVKETDSTDPSSFGSPNRSETLVGELLYKTVLTVEPPPKRGFDQLRLPTGPSGNPNLPQRRLSRNLDARIEWGKLK